jgi:hypothetical protein
VTVTAPVRRPPVAARRVGYLVAAGIHAVLLYLVNVSPGWQAVSFLTEDTRQVLGLVNVSLVAGLVCNLVYVFVDATWLRSLGDLLTTGIGLAVLVRLWQVFPFDFGDATVGWALVAHALLVVGIVGSAIGIVAQFVSLLRTLSTLRR